MKKKLIILLTMIFVFSSQLVISQAQIEIKDKYDLLYESLKDIYNNYAAVVIKMVVILIICLGWFITSEKSRNFFKKNRAIRIASIIVLVVIGIIHINDAIRPYKFSQDKISELSNLDYLEPKYYENYEITIGTLVINLIQNLSLIALLIVILYLLKAEKYKS
jgi:uncharacterized membrane protein YwzB